MTLKRIINDSQTEVFKPQKVDAVFGFKPFCCVQQLREGRPWVGFIFRCEVEDGTPVGQEGESKDVHWVAVEEVKALFEQTPEKLVRHLRLHRRLSWWGRLKDDAAPSLVSCS
jgi:hypothetical protein